MRLKNVHFYFARKGRGIKRGTNFEALKNNKIEAYGVKNRRLAFLQVSGERIGLIYSEKGGLKFSVTGI